AICNGDTPSKPPIAADSYIGSILMPSPAAKACAFSSPTAWNAFSAGMFLDHSRPLRIETAPQYLPSHSLIGVPSLYSYGSSVNTCDVDHFKCSMAGP